MGRCQVGGGDARLVREARRGRVEFMKHTGICEYAQVEGSVMHTGKSPTIERWSAR